ncbi:MAG: EamA family transporter [Candidatus Pacebacteria bacterium]|nr:EamA family transporter [Candidatus Paceibacterota bacterium]
MWILYAIGSSVCAALVALFGKIGLKNIDPTLATTVRGILMALMLVIISISFRKFNGFSVGSFSTSDWVYIGLSAFAGALSWLFYFIALKTGPVTIVAAIDRASIILVALGAIVFLGDRLGWQGIGGVLLIGIGMFLLTIK